MTARAVGKGGGRKGEEKEKSKSRRRRKRRGIAVFPLQPFRRKREEEGKGKGGKRKGPDHSRTLADKFGLLSSTTPQFFTEGGERKKKKGRDSLPLFTMKYTGERLYFKFQSFPSPIQRGGASKTVPANEWTAQGRPAYQEIRERGEGERRRKKGSNNKMDAIRKKKKEKNGIFPPPLTQKRGGRRKRRRGEKNGIYTRHGLHFFLPVNLFLFPPSTSFSSTKGGRKE